VHEAPQVEVGFTRAKNACNIIMKNLMDFGIGTLAFYFLGFGLMFGGTNGGWFGGDHFMFDATKHSASSKNWGWAFLLFQTVFCATAATIIWSCRGSCSRSRTSPSR
jgi:ammonium transporter, Amt family